MGSSKMAQRVKALAAKLDDLNLVSRTPTVEGENRSFILIIFMFVYLCVCARCVQLPKAASKECQVPWS